MLIRFASPLLTGICLLVCLAFFGLVSQYELVVSIVLVLVVGIPHGALDNELFKFLPCTFLGFRNQVGFFCAYIGLMITFLGVWLSMPTVALICFLTFTIYHFGQGDLEKIAFKTNLSQQLSICFWGSFVTLSPLLLQCQQTVKIVSKLVGYAIVCPSKSQVWAVVSFLVLANLSTFFWLYRQQILSFARVLELSCSMLILLCWFNTAPLILGFSVYFSLWHSKSSIDFQIAFFKKKKQHINWFSFMLRSLPLTIAAISFAGLIYFFVPNFKEISNEWVFIFASLISLPHVVLMDSVFKEMISKIY